MADLNRIKELLTKRTGKWLAGELNKPTCTVSKWCTNTAQPDLYTIDQIANLLGVDRRDLLALTNIYYDKEQHRQ